MTKQGPGVFDPAERAAAADEAIVDALHVNFLFSCDNRLPDGFGFGWESDRQVRPGA